MTTEDAPDRAQGARVPADHEAEAPGLSVELALVCSLHRILKELLLVGRCVERWFAEGRPVEGLPVAGPLADLTPLLALLAEVHDQPTRLLLPGAEAEVEEALWPVVRRFASPGVGSTIQARLFCFQLSGQLLPLLRQRLTVEATVNHPAFGISGDWAELHELVEARARSVQAEAPFVLDVTECFLAEELLERGRAWAEAGRPPALNPDDEVCIAWLADRIHWLPAPAVVDEAQASGHPRLRHEFALLILLTDPIQLCLSAQEAQEAAGSGDRDGPAAAEAEPESGRAPQQDDNDEWPLEAGLGETEPATP